MSTHVKINVKDLNVNSLVFRSDFHKCRKIFRALFARCLLFGHAACSVYFATQLNTSYYGIYAVCGFLFLLEAIVIFYFRYGLEWKKFCTCFICYLATMIPVLWLLRLNDMQTTLNNSSNNISSSNNNTLSSLMGNTKFASLLSGQNLTSLLEQSMMILIIICRWMLPRGRIDRNSMSQLLIMYSAIGADILDFSDTFDRIEVARNKNLAIVVLAVWSWSLLQFTVVITTAFTFRRRRGRETEPGGGGTHSANSREDISETLSIMMVLLMQDGPFLVTRGYMISKGVFNYMIMFFSLKNALTLILGLYRLCVLYGCVTREGNDLLRKSEIARSLDSLDDIDCQSNPKSKTVKGTKHQRF